jgi:hypothetical protein
MHAPIIKTDHVKMGRPRFERFCEAYRLMAEKAKYRPAAPGDGCGHVYLTKAELRDRRQLEKEAATYAVGFSKEEDTLKFYIGCSNFRTNRAFIWAIEAARNLAGGDAGNTTAIKLLEMAAEEVKRQQRGVAS